MFSKTSKIGVVGSGAMGSGIAQVAASSGHQVIIYDSNAEALEKAKNNLQTILVKLVDKSKITSAESAAITKRTIYAKDISAFKDCSLIIEAIVENLGVKQSVFSELEKHVSDDCILATNTSSLSITSIAAACRIPERVIGIHFFNPAPLMPLVEIIPALTTNPSVTENARQLIDSWKKITVVAKDTPGFIVNRVARSFYGESIRIYEEGLADFATIDWAMKEIGGFKMGPFELMDFIGNDINYKVTETVWEQFFYEPRFKPSFTQKRLFEAKFFGRKSGRGYYNYSTNATMPNPVKDMELGKKIFQRVISMLINEAIDSLYLQLASKDDLDLAMTKGVNYPKGLLKWADEIGLENCLKTLLDLQNNYGEDRYRPSILLKKMVNEKKLFF
ncbi:MAG TPA: 3-hydroxyacyl-CoA dehydrogenase NAD-binding domain-containing protein [Bacteroidia bacterium]|nr:3-hydroxyacyl-CoA dehydrogenase NAD-binding domain-containing protein [Bacteroidia bacterium]